MVSLKVSYILFNQLSISKDPSGSIHREPKRTGSTYEEPNMTEPIIFILPLITWTAQSSKLP
jgi:hypothetical protein